MRYSLGKIGQARTALARAVALADDTGDRTIVAIVRDMGERDLNGHAPILAAAPMGPSPPTFLSLP